MPMLTNGVYIQNADRAFEAEVAYYLNYHIISALASIDHLYSYQEQSYWENKCQYYHFYADHLLFSLGQIENRFIIIDGKDKGDKLHWKQVNIKNFDYCKEKYPILSDRRARNMMEHIDEYNQKIIQEKKGVGGFNLIDSTTDEKLVETLRLRTDTHPYTLDLQRKVLMVSRKGEDIAIDLDELRNELIQLQKSVKSFIELL